MFSCGALHTDEQGLGDQREPIYNSSVLILNVAWRSSWEQWTIETNGERGSGKFVQAERHDDIYIYIYMCVCVCVCVCTFVCAREKDLPKVLYFSKLETVKNRFFTGNYRTYHTYFYLPINIFANSLALIEQPV